MSTKQKPLRYIFDRRSRIIGYAEQCADGTWRTFIGPRFVGVAAEGAVALVVKTRSGEVE